MKTEQFLSYEAPEVEVIEVEVEQGFAVSGDPTGNATIPTLGYEEWD